MGDAACPRGAPCHCPVDVPVVVLGLRSSSQRRTATRQSFEALGCVGASLTFVDAVEATNWSDMWRWSSIDSQLASIAGCAAPPCRPAGDVEAAIALSHLRAARAALALAEALAAPAVLVLEDDADLLPAAGAAHGTHVDPCGAASLTDLGATPQVGVSF